MPLVAEKYQETLRLLATLPDYERQPPSDAGDYHTARIERLLALLDSPHRAAPAVHVAGTKGKGSVCILAAQLLAHVDGSKRVGLFNSPAVTDVRGQFTLIGYPLDRDRFVAAHERVLEAAQTMSREAPELGQPTRFEWLTALAFVAFAQAKTDINVIEVGLGGQLDATNLPDLPVVVAGIAPISLDHTDLLGDTLAQIAQAKAGILRQGVATAIARQHPSVERVLKEKVKFTRAPALWVGRHLTVSHTPPAPGQAPDHPECFRILRGIGPLKQQLSLSLPLLGAHQADNAALALAITDLFCSARKLPLLRPRQVQTAWNSVRAPCRIEIVARSPWVVIDGAHNPASMWVLTETLRERFGDRRWTMVFNTAADKNRAALWRMAESRLERMIFAPVDSPRFPRPDELLQAWRDGGSGIPAEAVLSAEQGLSRARATAGPDGVVVVTGSLHLAAEARRAVFSPDEV